MGLREHGSGTITARGKDTWQLRVPAGIDVITGRPRRYQETFHGSRKDALTRLRELAVLYGDGRGAPSNETLGFIIRRYREARSHSENTASTYDNALRLLPKHLAETAAADITTADIDRLYSALLKHPQPPRNRPASVHTVRTLHAVLGAAYNQAVKWGWLKHNPVAIANCPPKPRRAVRLPSDDGLMRLMELVAEDSMMLAWIRLLMTTGCRRGESLGLRWSDLNVERRELTIRRSLLVDGREKSTKTKVDREVVLDAVTLSLLLEWRGEQCRVAAEANVALAADPWVFSAATDASTTFRADVMYKRFVKLCKKAEIKTTPHKLRHLMVTKAIDGGESLRAVADRAGHSRTSITADVYTQSVSEADRRVADALGALMPLPASRRQAPSVG